MKTRYTTFRFRRESIRVTLWEQLNVQNTGIAMIKITTVWEKTDPGIRFFFANRLHMLKPGFIGLVVEK